MMQMLEFKNIRFIGGADCTPEPIELGDDKAITGSAEQTPEQTTEIVAEKTPELVAEIVPELVVEQTPISARAPTPTSMELDDAEINNIYATVKEYYQLCGIVKTVDQLLPLVNQLNIDPSSVIFTKREVELFLRRDKLGWRVNERIVGSRNNKKEKIIII
jgi:hypothetical protein